MKKIKFIAMHRFEGVVNKMMKLLFINSIIWYVSFSYAQNSTAIQDSLLLKISERLEELEYRSSRADRYKIYQTENVYNLLKLDTMTGMIEQLQWSLDDDEEGTMVINGEDLTYGLRTLSGAFELYPTKNMYQFILLDKYTGRTWHVQWGIGALKRWIRRIY